MDPAVPLAFLYTSTRYVPGFDVKYKDKSLLMKALGFLVKPFNPGFMTDFVTTVGSTVYVPSRAYQESSPHVLLGVLAHEYVHAWDSQKTWWFGLSYLFPQILVIIPLVLFAALAWGSSWVLLLPAAGYVVGLSLHGVSRYLFWGSLVVSLLGTLAAALWFTGWLTLFLLAAGVCLAPWPAPWRTRWELRGYGMSLAVARWITGVATLAHNPRTTKYFTGPDYYFMCRDREFVEAGLREFSGPQLLDDPPFKHVHDFLRESGLLWEPKTPWGPNAG